jgi:hypothetical protein
MIVDKTAFELPAETRLRRNALTANQIVAATLANIAGTNTIAQLTPSAFAAACMLPARAKAKKYLRSSHSNILPVCNFAGRTRNLATAQTAVA